MDRPTARARPSVWGLLLAAALLCPACARKEGRKPVHPVQGKVLMDSRPAAGATVVLRPADDLDAEANWPEGFPRGHAGADGTFTISTYSAGDGAPAGKYVVL